MLDNQSSVETLLINDATVVIFKWVFYGVICQLINIFGIVTNVINIVCFLKQGFKDPINVSLLGLSVSDLGSLITATWTCLSITPAFSSVDLPFECLDVVYLISAMPHLAFARISICVTAMIIFERCLSIAMPLKIKDIITPERTTLAVVCIYTIFLLSAAPQYVVNRLESSFSLIRNRTILHLVFREDKEQVEKISFTVNNFFIPLGAFMTIVVCTIILSSQLHRTTKWRKATVKDEQAERVSHRNKKVAKMVVIISTLYIICFIPTAIIMLAIAFEPALSINGKYLNITIVMGGLNFIMESINSSMNVFIYYHNSSKYRYTFHVLFYKWLID